MDSPSGTPRRRFLSAMTALVSAAIAGIAAIPILGAVLSPLKRTVAPPGSPNADSWIYVADLADLDVDVPKRVEVTRKTVDAWSAHEKSVQGAAWLIRRSNGSVEALSTVCPHLGCGVNFDQGNFRCPCHTSAFHVDGSVVSGPSPRSMDPLSIEVRERRVYLRYVRYKQGTSQRELI
jgi:menaquinol-cytochrome c reductase iron-sulfur subunit